MKITIEIETGNAAFDGNRASEIGRIVRDAAKKIKAEPSGNTVPYSSKLRDINGNTVGSVSVEP